MIETLWTGSVFGQAVGHQGVAAFVIGDALLFVLVDDPLLLFQAGGDALDPFVELVHADGRFALAGGQQRRFVDQVGQIGADEARRDAGDVLQLHRRRRASRSARGL